MRLTTLTIRNRKIDVHVLDNGKFEAEYKGQELEAATLDSLKEKLERAVRNDKIDPIRFIHWNGESLAHGMCTGLHATTGHMLVKWESEKQIAQHYALDGAIPPEHEAEYKKLCDAVVAAESARSYFAQQYQFDLKQQVKDALEKHEKSVAA